MEEPDPIIIGPSAEEIAEAVNFFSQGKNPVEKKTVKIKLRNCHRLRKKLFLFQL